MSIYKYAEISRDRHFVGKRLILNIELNQILF